MAAAGLLSQKLTYFIQLVSNYLIIPLLCFISTYISRVPFAPKLQKYVDSLKKNCHDIIFVEAEKEDEADAIENGDKKPEELHLKFKFPTFEEFIRIQKGTSGNLFNTQVFHSSTTNKYEFSSRKSCVSSAFTEVLNTFPVKEINGDDDDDDYNIGNFPEVSSCRNFLKVDEETHDAIEFEENKADSVEFQGNNEHNFFNESEFCSDEISDDFLSDGDFGDALDTDSENEKIGLENYVSVFEENHGLQEHDLHIPDSDFLSEKDFNEYSDNTSNAVFEPKPKDSSDSGDLNKMECLWEHQELIEQLQMELRKVKAIGLPTILEESESPKIMDELKPWKIDDKFQHEDRMGELHKFYKIYGETMRKFDILNYQKMYATGFLQLKDPFHSTPQRKPSAPTLKSLVSQNLWLCKHKSHGSDPVKKFINEMQGDLEVIYVGQMCLSWEFLHWQYEKVLDLWNSDPHGIRRYNEVAGEFQQFQVLMQRFKEDESFTGPRVQNYAKSRCVLRNLLQVPLIREDCLQDKNKGWNNEIDEYVITSEMLVRMVEESIRIFWQFVRSDKDSVVVSINGRKKNLQPDDLKLLLQVQKILQKKERKLRDILKSENCILRKFRQSREDNSDEVLHFFAQVDLKLVCRVVNMSRVSRDQLIWCQNKLSKISFVNRKIHVEPAFLLFPC